MKIYKRIFPLIIIAIVITFTNCEHDKLDSYEGKENVYFSFADDKYKWIDSLHIALGYDKTPRTDSLINIPIKIMGFQKDYVRPVNFTLIQDSSTAVLGVDIELVYENSFIAADSINGFVQVKIINSEKIKNNTLVAVVKTMPNEHFFADYSLTINGQVNEKGKIKGNIFRIHFDAKKDKPNLWAFYDAIFYNMFKTYSNTKLEFMCETLGMERSYFEYDPATENPNNVLTDRIGPFSLPWMRILQQALTAYEETEGPLIDENGKRVSFTQ